MSVEWTVKDLRQVLEAPKSGQVGESSVQDDIARQAYLIKKENENKLKRFIQARKLEYEKCRLNATRKTETENDLIVSQRGDKKPNEVLRSNKSPLKNGTAPPQLKDCSPELLLTSQMSPQDSTLKGTHPRMNDASELRQKLEQNRNVALTHFIEKRQRVLAEGTNRLLAVQEKTKEKRQELQEIEQHTVDSKETCKSQSTNPQTILIPPDTYPNEKERCGQNNPQERIDTSIVGKENNMTTISRGRELLTRSKNTQKKRPRICSKDVSVDDIVKQMHEEINSELQKMTKFESLNRSKGDVSSPESSYRELEGPKTEKKLEIDTDVHAQQFSTKNRISSTKNKLQSSKKIHPVTKTITLTSNDKERRGNEAKFSGRNQYFLTDEERSVEYRVKEVQRSSSKDEKNQIYLQKKSEKLHEFDEKQHGSKKENRKRKEQENLQGRFKGFYPENTLQSQQSEVILKKPPVQSLHSPQQGLFFNSIGYLDQVSVQTQLSPTALTSQFYVQTPLAHINDWMNRGFQTVLNNHEGLNYGGISSSQGQQTITPHHPLHYTHQTLSQQYQASDFMNNPQRYQLEHAQNFPNVQIVNQPTNQFSDYLSHESQQRYFAHDSQRNIGNKIQGSGDYESEVIKQKIKEQEDFLKKFQADTHLHLQNIRKEKELSQKINETKSPYGKTEIKLSSEQDHIQDVSLTKEVHIRDINVDLKAPTLASPGVDSKRLLTVSPEKWVKTIVVNGFVNSPGGNKLKLSEHEDEKMRNKRMRWNENERTSRTASKEAKYPKGETFEVFWGDSERCGQKETLAEAFKKKRRSLVERLEQEKCQYSKGTQYEPSKSGKRTKEELLRQRRMMMEYRCLNHQEYRGNYSKKFNDLSMQAASLMKECSPRSIADDWKNQNDDSKDQQKESVERLVSGRKAQLMKREMYDLTSKNFEQLPEVKHKKQEERRKDQLRLRKEKIKELDLKLRNNVS